MNYFLALRRRQFLAGLVTTAAAAAASSTPIARAATPADPSAPIVENPAVFAHSVASGDPLSRSVILWTRVTPTPEATPGSGIGDPTTVTWEVSPTTEFATIVASGTQSTDATRDLTVKVEATGLEPATTYYYRFTVVDGPAAGARSRTGRTRTAPDANADPGSLRFAVCSCSNYEAGFFNTYRDIAQREDLEFVLHLGDFTYEYASGEYGGPYGSIARIVAPANRTTTLADYRIRQGHYHLDVDLANMLAAKPLIPMWDDHEFSDNAWSDGASGNSIQPGDDFEAMRADATQAYYEWMPVRAGAGFQPADDQKLYRHLAYGTLAEIILPDLRSYRDKQNRFQAANADRSMMGRSQFDWFADVLRTSSTRWQLVGNEVMFAPFTVPASLDPAVNDWLVYKLGLPSDGVTLNDDQWDGYMAERQRIIDQIASENLPGVVFLTGDIHSSWVADIPANAADYRFGRNTTAVATEFVTPSITAASMADTLTLNPLLTDPVRAIAAESERLVASINQWHKYVELSQHGYMSVDVNAERVQFDYQYGAVDTPGAPLNYATSFAAFHGAPGARPANAGLDRGYVAF